MKAEMRSGLLAIAMLAAVATKGSELVTSAPYQEWRETWSYVMSETDSVPGGWATLGFKAEWRNLVKDADRVNYAWAGVIVDVKAEDRDGKRLYLLTKNIGWGDKAQEDYSFRFLVPRDSRKVTLRVGPAYSSGEFLMKDISLSLAAFDPVSPAIEFKGRSYEYSERGRKPVNPAPLPSAAEKIRLFRVDYPRMTFDRFAPEAAQLQDEFTLIAGRGETANLFLGVYAGEDLRISAEARGFPAGCELYRAHNHPNNAGRGQTYWIGPQALVPLADLAEVKKGGTGMVLAQFRIPADLASGVYRGEIVFRAGALERTAKVKLSVLPLRVGFPDPERYGTILHVGWYEDDPDLLGKVVADARSRGCESLLIACQYGNGRLELERVDGKMRVKRFDRFDHALAAFRKAGMKGTFYVHFSDKLEVSVARALGLHMPDGLGEQITIIPEMETEEFKRAAVEALQALKARAEGVKMAVLGMDEPDSRGRLPRSKWEIERIKEAGIPSCLYAGGPSYLKVRPDILLSNTRPGDEPYPELVREIEKDGNRLMLYGGSGSYGGSWGGVMPSRLLHGWGEFLLKESRGHTIWTCQLSGRYDPRSIEHFASFGSVYQHVGENRVMTTMEGEGCYEGMLDYAYLKALEEALKKVRGAQCPKADRIAAEFEKLKEEMRGKVPYRLDADTVLDPDREMKVVVTNADAVELRKRVARWLCELQCHEYFAK